jgi:hypothetical protein
MAAAGCLRGFYTPLRQPVALVVAKGVKIFEKTIVTY